MAESYYDRELGDDGTYRTAEDEAHEREVADAFAARWKCQVHSLGGWSPIDLYAIRAKAIVAWIEAKARSHTSTHYDTVLLNLRKWDALQRWQAGTSIPALYAVRFTDQIRWIKVNQIDASKVEMGGCRALVKSRTDREPVIHIPVAEMVYLAESRR